MRADPLLKIARDCPKPVRPMLDVPGASLPFCHGCGLCVWIADEERCPRCGAEVEE